LARFHGNIKDDVLHLIHGKCQTWNLNLIN
jgi:hypothetical protein